MILLLLGSIPDRHHCVAGEFVDDAAMVHNLGNDDVEMEVQQVDKFARWRTLCDGGEAAQISEHDCHLP